MKSIVVKIEEYLDSTYLKLPEEAGISIEETEVKINEIIEEGIASNFACVMIRPNFVSKAVEKIQTSKSKLKVGTVIDFPFGNSSTEKKIEEAEEAISNGAYDIDFVCDYNSFKRGSFVKFDADIVEGTKICIENKKITKWIIETGALSKDEIRNISKRITKIIQSKFPQYASKVFIKTSTGYYGGYGATIKDVKLIKSVSGNLKIKASGGISNLTDAKAMIKAGADRIGTSKAQLIYNEKYKISKMNFKELLVKAINASIEGGHAIMEVYASEFAVEHKDDKSPLTLADKNCNEVIENHLLETNIPFLSEEGTKISFDERKEWEYSWLVDPLDGTKEFVKRNGEFTVNIALIHNGNPIMGVIYVPVKEELYFALEGIGSYKISWNSTIEDLEDLISNSDKLPIDYNRINYVIVGSRSHMSAETEEFFEEKKKEHGNVEVMAVGSSLKLCMVAEGKADAYPRYAPTMEWDTGAGHAIAKYAGFSVKQFNSSDDVIYNKEDLLNPWFLVS